MRILMHCVYFPPEVGGLESHVYYLCRALVELGHDVAMVTSKSLPGLPDHEVMDGIDVWRTWFPSRNPVGWTAHAAASIPRTVALARGADLLHAQAVQSVPPMRVAAKAAGTPLVATYHTSHFLKMAAKPAWRPILRRVVPAADHNLAASDEIAAVVADLAPRTPVYSLTNGVETDVFRPVEPTMPPPEGGRRRVIVPRRLFPKNGVEYLVRALPLIAEELDVEAVLVGDGPERARLEELAGALGVTERIRFLGARPNTDMPGLLCSAELAVFPSLMEATSVAALECMACEIPVAASRVGGLPEIVDDGVGGLFEPADPADLARTVVRLLRRDDLPALGREARTRVVDRWSNLRLARRHLEIYQAVLERR